MGAGAGAPAIPDKMRTFVHFLASKIDSPGVRIARNLLRCRKMDTKEKNLAIFMISPRLFSQKMPFFLVGPRGLAELELQLRQEAGSWSCSSGRRPGAGWELELQLRPKDWSWGCSSS